ncbi:MAG TPA: ring-cleaving dioxygenase [Chthoniobacterales bacterium]|nr:ring-cleaving dioxygenase [Chthoniobacterales bacterium]
MKPISGLHHITAIAGPAQENLDFYAGVLGMRLVKKSVNQDDPGTYHLFYADAEGHPGSDLTFFPWAELAPSRAGYGLSTEVSLAVPPGSLRFWSERLAGHHMEMFSIETRFGERVLPLRDPHGLRLALVESESSLGRIFAPWEGSPIPREHQIRGLESARIVERDLAAPLSFLTDALGFQKIASENGWLRYGLGAGKSGQYLDLQAAPEASRGAWGTGSVHHIAWRVADDAHELEVRAEVERGGAQPTPVIDRFWFKSVYFREPGGVLFELATDGPGFHVDEEMKSLGETLVLPPWLEPNRQAIESVLPKLTLPNEQVAA